LGLTTQALFLWPVLLNSTCTIYEPRTTPNAGLQLRCQAPH
jgi:hypothetical protein